MAQPSPVPEHEPSPPADFDGSGTAIIVTDNGYSPFYDQSNTVYGTDFYGANDPSAQTYKLNSHGSWVAEVITDGASGTDIIHLKVFSDTGGGASGADQTDGSHPFDSKHY